jgi:hypothetical protein
LPCAAAKMRIREDATLATASSSFSRVMDTTAKNQPLILSCTSASDSQSARHRCSSSHGLMDSTIGQVSCVEAPDGTSETSSWSLAEFQKSTRCQAYRPRQRHWPTHKRSVRRRQAPRMPQITKPGRPLLVTGNDERAPAASASRSSLLRPARSATVQASHCMRN